ncbi:LUD domain-containing protein [Cohnella sp. AR92]|uniref:LutC/YkgG family protein n=1 Tax=Cohnella sp. AR92 TaxID=648716 RepID=UPI000F8CB38D|nr:LUD domain-containing protein [Cohnella sp. AR92]RUS46256.1 lactate utilization protein C [Cohnella sp. AR92]
MADTHEQWLREMEEQSKAKQASFMAGIAQKLKHPRVTEAPAHPFRGAPDFWNELEWSLEEKIERFSDNWKSVGGHVARLADMDAARDFIAAKAQEMGAKYIVRQNEAELDSLGLEAALPDARVSVWNTDPDVYWKARSAEADFGVVMADHSVAYTGSVVVKSSKDKGRSVSLLPTVMMILIPVDKMKTRLGEVLVEFDRAGRDSLPAGIHFITGPSRSSDIENDLTIGVHGPGIVYALLVG